METPKPALQLSAVQIIAGALASVSAAVVASTFGVTGTLLGAALGSVVSTIAAALYTHSLADAAPGVHAAIDAAYHVKYDRYGPRIVGSVGGPAVAGVTLQLVPRPTT